MSPVPPVAANRPVLPPPEPPFNPSLESPAPPPPPPYAFSVFVPAPDGLSVMGAPAIEEKPPLEPSFAPPVPGPPVDAPPGPPAPTVIV